MAERKSAVRIAWGTVVCLAKCLPPAMSKSWQSFRGWIGIQFERLLTPTLVLISLILLFATVGMLALLSADLATELGQSPPSWAAVTRKAMLWLFAADSNAMTAGMASKVLSTLTVVVAIWSVVVPLVALRKHRKAIAAAKTIEIKPIHSVGQDDIETLTHLLEEAKEAIIFAGRFDWLLKCKEMKKQITNLAKSDAIVMVSSQDEASVRQAFDTHADKDDEFRDLVLERLVAGERRIDIRLTIVKYVSGDSSCCTMVTNDQGTAHATRDNMLVRPTTDDRRVLLNIINTLCDVDEWKEKLKKKAE